jgi:hypothetical protein
VRSGFSEGSDSFWGLDRHVSLFVGRKFKERDFLFTHDCLGNRRQTANLLAANIAVQDSSNLRLGVKILHGVRFSVSLYASLRACERINLTTVMLVAGLSSCAYLAASSISVVCGAREREKSGAVLKRGEI